MATDCLMPYAPQRQFQKDNRLYPDLNALLFDSQAPPVVSALPSAPPFPTLPLNSGETASKSITGDVCNNTNNCMFGLPEEVRYCLAMYLSSGDPAALSITPDNVCFFMTVANTLHHRQLRDICQNYMNEHGDVTNVRKELEGNCTNCTCLKSKSLSQFLTAPVFAIMFAMPSDTGQPNQVLVMDVRSNEIHKIDVRKVTRFGEGFASCAVYKKGCPYIMVSGGCGKTSRTLLKYDVVENKWSNCDDMLYARSKHVMVFLNGNVYIIGGKLCSSVERYNPENNICLEVTKLKESVHSTAACVYGEDIYIFGGKTIKGNVSCVQKLETRLNVVVKVADLPVPCSGGYATVVDDVIYYATNNGHTIKFVPRTGESELCKSQPYRRKHFAMFQRNHELFVFGGVKTEGPDRNSDSSETKNTLIKYCTKSDTWFHVHSYKESVPVYTCCTVKYPKACPVKPFMKLFGYC